MLTLSTRQCLLGGDHSGKTKDKDGTIVKTLTFELEDFLLDDRELNTLLGEPNAWNALYDDRNGEITPFLKCFKSLEFEKSIEGAFVKLVFGLDRTEITFTDAA